MVPVRRLGAGGTGLVSVLLALALVPALALAVAHGPGADNGRPKPTSSSVVASPTPTAAPASPGVGAVGGHVTIGAVTMSIAVVPGVVRQGKPAEARVSVTNQTGAALVGIVVALRSLDPAVVVRPVRDTIVKRLDALASTTLTWTVCVTGAGTRAVSLVATATTDGISVSSPPYVAMVIASRRC